MACLLVLLPQLAEARRHHQAEDRGDDCAQYVPSEAPRRTITLSPPGQTVGWYEPQAEDGGRLPNSPDVVLADAGSSESDGATTEAEPDLAPLQIGGDVPKYTPELAELVLILNMTMAVLGIVMLIGLILVLRT